MDEPALIREAQSGNLAGIKLPQGVSIANQVLLQHAIDQSFIDGFRVVMFICAALALLSSLAAALLIEGKRTLPREEP